MKYGKSVIAVLALIALLVGLSGCAKEGPMEKAGKKVDKAIEDIKK
jgi:predicted small lipoprotein YifL